MLQHVFSHNDDEYVVSFRVIDGQWLAALYRRGDDKAELLPQFAEAKTGRLSDDAIRAGYIGVAHWIVTGRSAAKPTLETGSVAPASAVSDAASLDVADEVRVAA